MKLTRATPQAIKYACTNYHYSKTVPVNPIGYNVYNGADEWCGVILYGTGAIPNIGRPYNLPQGAILELTRVALNGKQEATSQAVAMSLKRLHKDVHNAGWSYRMPIATRTIWEQFIKRQIGFTKDCRRAILITLSTAERFIVAAIRAVSNTSVNMSTRTSNFSGRKVN